MNVDTALVVPVAKAPQAMSAMLTLVDQTFSESSSEREQYVDAAKIMPLNLIQI